MITLVKFSLWVFCWLPNSNKRDNREKVLPYELDCHLKLILRPVDPSDQLHPDEGLG